MYHTLNPEAALRGRCGVSKAVSPQLSAVSQEVLGDPFGLRPQDEPLVLEAFKQRYTEDAE